MNRGCDNRRHATFDGPQRCRGNWWRDQSFRREPPFELDFCCRRSFEVIDRPCGLHSEFSSVTGERARQLFVTNDSQNLIAEAN